MSDPVRKDLRFIEILAVTQVEDRRKRVWSSRQIAEAIRCHPDLAPTLSLRQTGLSQAVGRALRDFRCERYRNGRSRIRWLLPDIRGGA